MRFFEKFVAGVEMARPLDANDRVKMVVGKIQFGRVHDLEGAAGRQRARIRNLRVGNVNAGNHPGRISLRQPLCGTAESASHIQNPACFGGDSRDHLIDEGFARLPLRLSPCAPVPEIEISAVPVIATLIAAAHHAVKGAGTHRPSHRHHAPPRPAAHQCAIACSAINTSPEPDERMTFASRSWRPRYLCRTWWAFGSRISRYQMIAWRTLAETHSLTTTVAMMMSRMSETWVQASVVIAALSGRPMPPAPTSPSTVDSRMLMSQRNTETPANVGRTCGTIPYAVTCAPLAPVARTASTWVSSISSIAS